MYSLIFRVRISLSIMNSTMLSVLPTRVSNYEIVKYLNKGGFGTVYKAKKNDNVFAVKHLPVGILRTDTPPIENEVTIWRKVRHQNIVVFYESFADSDAVYIVMELCEGGDLNSKILTDSSIETSQLLTMISQIANGLDYLHQNRIIHRDVKPLNILLHHEQIKLGDFSNSIMSNFLDHGTPQYIFERKARGPRYYTPPEVFTGKISFKGDVFSFGCVMIAMFSKSVVVLEGQKRLVPSVEVDVAWASDKEKKNLVEEFIVIPQRNGNRLQKLILEMTDFNWESRPAMREVFKRIKTLEK